MDKNHKDRIQNDLINKGYHLKMQKLMKVFASTQIQRRASQLIKLEVRWRDQAWRDQSMELTGKLTETLDLKPNDFWLLLPESEESKMHQDKLISVEETTDLIRVFNKLNYGAYSKLLNESIDWTRSNIASHELESVCEGLDMLDL